MPVVRLNYLVNSMYDVQLNQMMRHDMRYFQPFIEYYIKQLSCNVEHIVYELGV